MTTYNTGNPVPSADARDRYDNSQTLDEVVNGDSASYSTRTGKQVISLGGMNSRFNNAQDERDADFNLSQEEKQESFQKFLDGTGWSSLGAYGAGVVITSHTQTVDYLGQPYSLKPSIPASLDAPYVTTGVWATEGVNFKLVGDNSLRQDLSDPNVGPEFVAAGKLWFPTPYLDTVSKIAQGEQVSIYRFIPSTEIENCRSGTSDFLISESGNFEDALSKSINLFVPAGVYLVQPNPNTPGVPNEYAAGKICLPIRSGVTINGNGVFRLAPGNYGASSGAIFGTPDNAVDGITLTDTRTDGNRANVTGAINGIHLVGPVNARLSGLICVNSPAVGAIGGVNIAIRSSAGARKPVNCQFSMLTSVNAGYIGAQFDRAIGLTGSGLIIDKAVDNGLDIFGNDSAGDQDNPGMTRQNLITNLVVKDVGGSAVFFESGGNIDLQNINLRNFGNGGLFYNRINSGALYINVLGGHVGNDSGLGTGVIFKNSSGRGTIGGIQFHDLEYSFDARSAQYMHIAPNNHRNIQKEILKVANVANNFWRGKVDEQIYQGAQDPVTLMPQPHSPNDNPLGVIGRIAPYNPDSTSPNIITPRSLSTGRPFASVNYTRKTVNLQTFPSSSIYSKFESGETVVYLSGSSEPTVGDLALISGGVWQFFSRPATANFTIRKYVAGSYVAGDYTADLASGLAVLIKLPGWTSA